MLTKAWYMCELRDAGGGVCNNILVEVVIVVR